jgi:hypothetical protein
MNRALLSGLLVPIAIICAVHSSASGAPPAGGEMGAEPGAEVARLQIAVLAPAGVQNSAAAEPGTLALIFRDALVNVPFAGAGTNVLWFGGLTVRELSLEFSGTAPAFPPVRELHSAAIHAGTYWRVDAEQVLLAIVSTGRYADDLHADVPLSTGGIAVWRWLLGADSRWGLGISATADLGDPGLVPLLEYARWDARWTANLRLPLEGQVRYWLTEWVSVGGHWLVQGGQYYVTGPGSGLDTARVTAGTLGAVVAIGRRNGALLELEGGRTLFRRYRSLKEGEVVQTLNFAPAEAYALGVAWRF